MSTVSGVPDLRLLPVKRCRWCVLMNTNCCVISKTAEKEIPRIAIPGYEPDPSIKAEPIQNGRQQRGGGGRGKVVVAVNSNHAVRKVVRSLVTRSPQKNRLVVSAMPNRQANNNVAAVRVNLPLRSNLYAGRCPASSQQVSFYRNFILGNLRSRCCNLLLIALSLIINCMLYTKRLAHYGTRNDRSLNLT